MITNLLYRIAKRSLPQISATESEALKVGEAWWEGELLKGAPQWQKLENLELSKLTDTEQSFLEHETEILCNMIDEWQILQEDKALPPKVWQYICEAGFLGLVIPKEFGGKGFSALLHSQVLVKIATKSLTAAVSVMVPNSLGPAELLRLYGTDEQKRYYLPRLARGEDIPCFALTGVEAGSDATAMQDYGVVSKEMVNGIETIGIRLSFQKRYITLAPIATLIGLAFKLYDPEHLLSEKDDVGITLCLLPHNHPGLHIGDRHLPMNQAFMNGTIEGQDLFVPIDWIIGGKERAGEGWTMLVECLSIGRAISLPALSTATAALTYVATGAYANIREQFNVKLGHFEGIEELLAEMAGWTYLMDATRLLTLTAVDNERKPAVASAIAKYHMTEMARKIINHAMDIHGGRGIMMGPKNYLANIYESMPVSITVEGANVLTRNLIIYGQGVMSCHPYLRQLSEVLSAGDTPENRRRFGKILGSYFGYLFKNRLRYFLSRITFGAFLYVPQSKVSKYYRQAAMMSQRLSLLSDFALLSLGGKLKRKERLSARLGDALSHLYMASAVLKYYQAHYEPDEEKPVAIWTLQYSLAKTYQALSDFIDNYQGLWPRWLLRFWFLPLRTPEMPSDRLSHQVAGVMLSDNPLRKRLYEYCFIPSAEDEGPSLLERALKGLHINEELIAQVKNWVKEGKIDHRLSRMQQVYSAYEQGLIDDVLLQRYMSYEKLRVESLQVDTFTHDLRLIRRAKMTSAGTAPVSLERQFEEMVERVRSGKVDLQPTPAQKLQLYGLYKQATEGDITGESPVAMDFVARAKFQAWEKCKGMSKEQAMREYINLFNH